jgi:DNA mismatch repair protein MSH4
MYIYLYLFTFIARQTYKEATEDIYELVSNYTQRYGMQMKLQFTASSAFYITMAISQLNKNGGELPEEFINVITRKKSLQFTTLELVTYNQLWWQ